MTTHNQAMHEKWCTDAREIVSAGWAQTDHLEHHTARFRQAVLDHRLSIEGLRNVVYAANQLDRQATLVAESKGELDGDDLTELVAHRLFHHAARGALHSLRSKWRRDTAHAQQNQATTTLLAD